MNPYESPQPDPDSKPQSFWATLSTALELFTGSIMILGLVIVFGPPAVLLVTFYYESDDLPVGPLLVLVLIWWVFLSRNLPH